MKRIFNCSTIAAIAATVTLTSCGALYASGGTDVYDSNYDNGAYGYGTDLGYQAGYGGAGYGIAYEEARDQALFLSDKMAYELGLTESQYAAVYEINLDYLLSIDNHDNLYSTYWTRRNSDLFYVLDATQYNRYIGLEYFYRPVYWYDNAYAYRVYNRYANRTHFYYSRPEVYNSYRGGHNRTASSYYEGHFGKRTGNPNWHYGNGGGSGNWHYGNGGGSGNWHNGNGGGNANWHNGNGQGGASRQLRDVGPQQNIHQQPSPDQPAQQGTTPSQRNLNNGNFGGARDGGSRSLRTH